MNKLSHEARTYLKEIFGYDSIETIDSLTMECIEENAKDRTAPGGNGYPFDKEIVEARKALTSPLKTAKVKA